MHRLLLFQRLTTHRHCSPITIGLDCRLNDAARLRITRHDLDPAPWREIIAHREAWLADLPCPLLRLAGTLATNQLV